MHRSGTSFLTGSFQEAGLELGKFSEWNPHNLKGNRENGDIVAFHDAVLAARGYSWDNPPNGEVVWTDTEYARAKRLVSDFGSVPRWGFKDPRSLLCVSAWQALLPDLHFVGIFRHPVAVAQSLAARGGMPQAQAFALWAAYNQRLLALHQKQAFPLLCFDEDEATLQSKLDTVLCDMGLQVPQGQRFFSAELKHHRDTEEELPESIEQLYRALRSRAC